MNVLMPQLGETVAEGTVSIWHKNVGDNVAVDEILLDVETDKVSMEIPAPRAGVLAEIKVQAGETVDVGTVLAIIQGEGEELPASSAPQSANPGVPSEAPHRDADEPTVIEPTAITEIAVAHYEPTSGTPAAAPRQSNSKLSPSVRRLVAEHKLDIAAIEGSGRNGRVTRRDVLAFVANGPSAASAPTAPASASTAKQQAPASPAPELTTGRIPFNRIRKLTADHMVMSKATSPHVLQAVEVNFAGVERVRKAVRESWKTEHGFSLTYLPFIAHAVCRALAEFPHANASVDNDSLVLHDHVNLAIAIDLGADGLMAPVIKAAETMSITELAQAVQDLAKRARSQKLKPDDLAGGTYTLSNSGSFGTLITAPIINQPQVAILSTDGVRKKPVVIEGPDGDSIGIRPIGILAQSFDHRAFDGAYSAAFLARVRGLIETNNWFREL